MEAIRTTGRWLMSGPRRRKVFDTATDLGLKAIGGKIRGGPMKGLRFHGGDTLGYLLGQSEPQVQQTILRHLPEGGVFFDVGANIGFHTLLGRLAVGPEGQIHAFEPLKENVAQLHRNLAANEYEAVVHTVALSNEAGQVTMVCEGPLGRAHLGDGDVTVRAVRLDDLGLPAPDVVKIDVEGAESRVLEGMRRTLSEHRPVLVIEIHHDQEMPVRWLLSEHGYNVERLEDGGMPHLVAS